MDAVDVDDPFLAVDLGDLALAPLELAAHNPHLVVFADRYRARLRSGVSVQPTRNSRTHVVLLTQLLGQRGRHDLAPYGRRRREMRLAALAPRRRDVCQHRQQRRRASSYTSSLWAHQRCISWCLEEKGGRERPLDFWRGRGKRRVARDGTNGNKLPDANAELGQFPDVIAQHHTTTARDILPLLVYQTYTHWRSSTGKAPSNEQTEALEFY